MNVAAGRWLQGRGGSRDDRFWEMELAGFVFRFATIFGGAGLIWAAHHRMPEVATFIITGAVAQMVGQIYFLIKDKKKNA